MKSGRKGLINLEIAGVNFSVNCRNAEMLHDFDPAYGSFLRSGKDPSAANVEVDLEFGGLPDMKRSKKIFDSGQSWSIFFDGANYFLSLNPPAFDRRPVWTAKFDLEFDRITVYCGEMLKKGAGGLTVSNPVCYPLDQLLLMYVLAQKGGAILHAAGISLGNRGCVFPGSSGAGKSTLLRQFSGASGAELLSDDRVVVRRTSHTFKAFGTPWPGEAAIAENKSVPLSGIFFISHGSDNRIRELGRKEALERLLPVTSIPWYDQAVMTKILDFCDDLSSHVPAYELFFRPDGEVVRVLERFVSTWEMDRGSGAE